MQERTYDMLPSDVVAGLLPGAVSLNEAIPPGVVDVISQGKVTRMPVNAFVRARRKARKAERKNRAGGHR